MEEVIFAGQSDEIQAVGFKVFPDQLEKHNFNVLYDWIEQNPDVSLIMLNRQNSLKTLCSVEIAKKNRRLGH